MRDSHPKSPSSLANYWFTSTCHIPYFLRNDGLLRLSVFSPCNLNCLFCTILANRSLGKDLVAPRQKETRRREIKKIRETSHTNKRQRESNYISIYGFGARSHCFRLSGPPRAFSGSEDMVIHYIRRGGGVSSTGMGIQKSRGGSGGPGAGLCCFSSYNMFCRFLQKPRSRDGSCLESSFPPYHLLTVLPFL
ncbi:hypothetical protein GGR54DRAFT_617409, partial [Hypoxylon sp. NC1633]